MSRCRSRRRFEHCEEKDNFFGIGNCCCDFSTLIILILIILQFNRRRDCFGITSVCTESTDCGTIAPQTFGGGHNLIDNSILFIIALFFLSCCNPCRK